MIWVNIHIKPLMRFELRNRKCMEILNVHVIKCFGFENIITIHQKDDSIFDT